MSNEGDRESNRIRRLVIFTANPSLRTSQFMPAILSMPGLQQVLLVTQVKQSDRSATIRRLWRNLQRHGPLFVPYRAWVALRTMVSTGPTLAASSPASSTLIEVTELTSSSLHAPHVMDAIRHFTPDLGISCGAPILRRTLFSIPRDGTINLHCGSLPSFRGMPPGFWELSTGAPSVGASVHWMDDQLDNGWILDSASVKLDPSRDSIADAEARALELGCHVLSRTLQTLATTHVPGEPQSSEGRTFRSPLVRQRMALGARLLARRFWRRASSIRFLVRSALTIMSLAIYRPIRDVFRTITRRHPVRIFTFHRVTRLLRDGMTVSRECFAKQVEYIARTHDVVPLDQALEVLASGQRLQRPIAVLTFDDGYESVLAQAEPELRVRNLVATVFIATAFPGTDRRFEHDQGSAARDFLPTFDWINCNRLIDQGWSVGGHTRNHARVSSCTPTELSDEIGGSFGELMKHIPRASPTLAFPFGQPTDISEEAVLAARRAGYEYTFGDFGGENFPGRAGTFLRRIDIGGDHDEIAWRAHAHAVEPGTLLRLRSWRARVALLDAAAREG